MNAPRVVALHFCPSVQAGLLCQVVDRCPVLSGFCSAWDVEVSGISFGTLGFEKLLGKGAIGLSSSAEAMDLKQRKKKQGPQRAPGSLFLGRFWTMTHLFASSILKLQRICESRTARDLQMKTTETHHPASLLRGIVKMAWLS